MISNRNVIVLITCLLAGLVNVSYSQDEQNIWQWAQQVGGKGYESVSGLVIDSEDNIIIAGSYTRELDIKQTLESHGKQDVFVASYTNNRKLNWIWTTGSIGNDQVTSIKLLPDTELLVAGNLAGKAQLKSGATKDGEKNLFVIRLNKKGKSVWSKVIPYTHSATITDIAYDFDGNALLLGSYRDTISCGEQKLVAKGERDVFLIKIESSGEIKEFKGIGGISDELPAKIDIDTSGNIYLTASYSGDFNIDDTQLYAENEGLEKNACLLKFDSELSLTHAKTFTSSEYLSLDALTIDRQNNLYLGGVFNPQLTIDTETISAVGQTDVFIVKIDPLGNLQWQKVVGSPKSEYMGSLLIDKLNGIIFTGAFNDTILIDSIQLDFNGSYSNSFIGQFTSEGKTQWIEQISSEGSNLGRHGAVDSDGNVFLSGEFRNELITKSEALTSRGNSDIFFAKYYNCEILDKLIEGDTELCPGGELVLKAGVKSKNISWNDTIINESELLVSHPGRYWITLIGSNGCTYKDTVDIKLAKTNTPFLGNDTIVKVSDKVLLETLGNYESFEWQDNSFKETFLATSSEEEQVEYYVLTTDSSGCIGSDTIAITYVDNNAWIVFNDGSFRTYPNPVEDFLSWSLDIEGKGKLDIELTDVIGNQIYFERISEYIPNDIYQIDMRSYKPGVYYLTVSNPDRRNTVPIIFE